MVADSTLDLLFALAQEADGHDATAAQRIAGDLLGTGRVTVAHWKCTNVSWINYGVLAARERISLLTI